MEGASLVVYASTSWFAWDFALNSNDDRHIWQVFLDSWLERCETLEDLYCALRRFIGAPHRPSPVAQLPHTPSRGSVPEPSSGTNQMIDTARSSSVMPEIRGVFAGGVANFDVKTARSDIRS